MRNHWKRAVLGAALVLWSTVAMSDVPASPAPVVPPGHFKDGTRFNLRCTGQFDVPPEVVKLATPSVPNALLGQRSWEDLVVRRYSMRWLVKTYFDIDVQGRPKNVRSDKTEPRIFGKGANTTMQQWRFHPATRNGQPVEVACEQVFDYDLRTSEQKRAAASDATGEQGAQPEAAE